MADKPNEEPVEDLVPGAEAPKPAARIEPVKLEWERGPDGKLVLKKSA